MSCVQEFNVSALLAESDRAVLGGATGSEAAGSGAVAGTAPVSEFVSLGPSQPVRRAAGARLAELLKSAGDGDDDAGLAGTATADAEDVDVEVAGDEEDEDDDEDDEVGDDDDDEDEEDDEGDDEDEDEDEDDEEVEDELPLQKPTAARSSARVTSTDARAREKRGVPVVAAAKYKVGAKMSHGKARR